MGVNVSSKRRGRFRRFWLKLKGWQKGGITGLLISLVFVILIIINQLPEHNTYNLTNWYSDIFFMLFFVLIPIILIGLFIGLLSSFKNKLIWISALIGGLFGLVNTIIAIGGYWFISEWFAKPTLYLLGIILGDLEYSSITLFITLFLSFIIYTIIGIIIGITINKIKGNKE